MTDVRGEKLVLSSRSVLSYVAEVPASTLAGVPELLLLRSLRDLSLSCGPDRVDGGLSKGLIRSDCLVPWSVPVSVRLCLSA